MWHFLLVDPNEAFNHIREEFCEVFLSYNII